MSDCRIGGGCPYRKPIRAPILRQRSVQRPSLNDSDRLFWSMACEFLENWKEHLVIVKPETVIRWHRQGFRYYWRWMRLLHRADAHFQAA